MALSRLGADVPKLGPDSSSVQTPAPCAWPWQKWLLET